jgi:hypothetical protein
VCGVESSTPMASVSRSAQARAVGGCLARVMTMVPRSRRDHPVRARAPRTGAAAQGWTGDRFKAALATG